MKALVLHFNLGYSYQNNVSVRSEIFTRLPVTLSLTAGAFIVWMLAAIPVGIVSAIRRRSPLDRATMGGRLVAISAPVYFLGLLALFLFSNDIGVFHLLPGAGSYTPFSHGTRGNGSLRSSCRGACSRPPSPPSTRAWCGGT